MPPQQWLFSAGRIEGSQDVQHETVSLDCPRFLRSKGSSVVYSMVPKDKTIPQEDPHVGHVIQINRMILVLFRAAPFHRSLPSPIPSMHWLCEHGRGRSLRSTYSKSDVFIKYWESIYRLARTSSADSSVRQCRSRVSFAS